MHRTKESDTARIIIPVIAIVLIGLMVATLWLFGRNEAEPAHNAYAPDFSQEWNDSDGNIYTNLSYAKKENEYYNLYIPDEAKPGDEQALMLFVHGGGWRRGDCEDNDDLCKMFAKEGYITATISYSLLSDDEPEVTFDYIMNEFDECLFDIKEECAELGFPVNKSAIYGYSAGAHLTMFYAYTRAETAPIKINFIMAMSGPTDFRKAAWKGSNYWDDDNELAHVASMAAGFTITPDMLIRDEYYYDNLAAILSPIGYINTTSVPTILAHGVKDITVPIIHSDEVAAALEKNHVPYSYIVFNDSTHLLENNPESMDEWSNTVLEYADKYLNE